MSSIRVRRPSFVALERGVSGLWNPDRPELSHTLNAFQLALPYLEPYFIDAVKQASSYISDPQLKRDAADFCAQEANHSREHKRYNKLLHARYPKLADFERHIKQSLIESRQHDSLEWRLAYTAGYEAITVQLARVLFMHRDDWFAADPDSAFAQLLTWHAAEEIEHRHVAHDVLSCVTSQYGLRVGGLLRALQKTYADMNPAIDYMLKVDGYGGVSSKLRRLQVRSMIGTEVVPALMRYLLPSYHPSHECPPNGFAQWQLSNMSEGVSAPAE